MANKTEKNSEPETNSTVTYSPKSRMKALLFAGLLGQVGIHSFYLGHILAGVAHCILFCLSIVTISFNSWISLGIFALNINWTIIEIILISSGCGKDKYHLYVKNWKSTRKTFNRQDYIINDWVCPKCQTKNFASFAFCAKCGEAKEL